MGIEVQRRDERGEILGEVSDADMTLSRTGSALSDTRLLKYLVPWGDAMFNQAQAADLDADIRHVIETRPGSRLAERLREVRLLVDKLCCAVCGQRDRSSVTSARLCS